VYTGIQVYTGPNGILKSTQDIYDRALNIIIKPVGILPNIRLTEPKAIMWSRSQAGDSSHEWPPNNFVMILVLDEPETSIGEIETIITLIYG